MVLSDRTIKEEIARGRIVIDPYDESCVQPASVDIHLGRRIRVFRHWVHPHLVDLRQPLDGLTQAVQVKKNTPFSLQPGQFILGTTVEYIAVPDDMMARLEGKSSLGRVGLLIHSTAGYVDPGWKGHLTLELYNVCPVPILLYPGMKVSQISFHRLTTPVERPYGSPGLGSKYQDQTEPTATRIYQEFLQGSLMSPAAVPTSFKQKLHILRENILRDWLKQSEFRGSPKRLAEAIATPAKTVEDWIYRGAEPNRSHRIKLFKLTGLPEFRVKEAESRPSVSLLDA